MDVKNFVYLTLIEDVKRGYGIELTLSERFALWHYYQCFKRAVKKPTGEGAGNQFQRYFMLDYFGLDSFEIDKMRSQVEDSFLFLDGDRLLRGMSLLGDERFKEYCRRHVDEWRAEREMI